MAAKKKKALKAQTLTEFKAWLSGVEEMQEEGWVPNEQQWELIRERIDRIKEDEPKKDQTTQHSAQPRGTHPVAQQPVDVPMIPSVPSAFDKANVREDSTLRAVRKLPPTMATDPSKPVKTPEIDTSKGEYKSGFL